MLLYAPTAILSTLDWHGLLRRHPCTTLQIKGLSSFCTLARASLNVNGCFLFRQIKNLAKPTISVKLKEKTGPAQNCCSKIEGAFKGRSQPSFQAQFAVFPPGKGSSPQSEVKRLWVAAVVCSSPRCLTRLPGESAWEIKSWGIANPNSDYFKKIYIYIPTYKSLNFPLSP